MSTKTNKRYLKKEIRRICAGIAGECVKASLSIPGIDRKKLENIIIRLAELQENTIRLISVGFPGSESAYPTRHDYKAARYDYYKAAYRKLKGDFNTRISELLGEMNSLLSDEAREANKQSAS